MTEPTPDALPPHQRRRRYRGTHPRRFGEKYKELAPAQYPDLVAHVRSRGQTPAGQHVPILTEELMTVLAPSPGERGVDCTLGWGGHAERALERIAPGGRLLALDIDPLQLPQSERRLRALGHDERVLLVRQKNFAALGAVLHEIGWSEGADFVYADLGVSSMQIDDPARGFSFQQDGPLDMRMNPSRGSSAAQWLERATFEDLRAALSDHADEPHAASIALAIAERRGTLDTTRALVEVIRHSLPARLAPEEVDLSVRRTFQALRIEVNRELEVLDAWLRQLPASLRPGGRVAAITFHSGEDRRVKHSFQQGLRDGTYAAVSDEVIRPSSAEQRSNPRSSPAKLRWARKG
ncbi:MAG: 16S rRNA (cytosine(1402)-N(4))-methyltransferase RsmH [Planctomycetota bacterium]